MLDTVLIGKITFVLPYMGCQNVVQCKITFQYVKGREGHAKNSKNASGHNLERDLFQMILFSI